VKVISLFSGGKDSTLALFLAMQQGYDVVNLLTLLPEKESMMFHHPNVELTALQAEAMGMMKRHVMKKTTNKGELEDLKRELQKMHADAVVSGAIASEYQKQRVDLICEELGLRHFAPLWRKGPAVLLQDLIDAGFEVMITAVAGEGLDEGWLGRMIDEKSAAELAKIQNRLKISAIFEGGEGETLVLDAPFFIKKLKIENARKAWNGTAGELIIDKASLAAK